MFSVAKKAAFNKQQIKTCVPWKIELEETGKKQYKTGRNRKTGRKKHQKTVRNWIILKKQEETGRNRKNQEERSKTVDTVQNGQYGQNRTKTGQKRSKTITNGQKP